ncbi:GNAT family N-acetyltransferase [Enterovibrio paralichthyis]|uniref:GNAT family N-acetyltransferase n=1 Tax=Enterovibrio paralichthyis TaxID=2853805 RepID=UPI001C48C2C6|nr:GNAT family N-acetyltransferase [Enterovibrio paralichthyis]MBV7297081.1 GNAT family N-acetyltransferase [Enterovibrio paralichthyis]
MEIRKVVLKDLEAVQQLVNAVSKLDVMPLLNEQGQEEYKSRVLPDLATTFDDSRFYTVIALNDDVVIGFAALREGNYLTHLFVSKSAQGAGLGKTLLNHVLATTEAKEISLRSSLNASSFYASQGFETTGDEAAFNGIRFVPMRLVR